MSAGPLTLPRNVGEATMAATALPAQPRLLLPPRHEPRGVGSGPAAANRPPVTRSVLSPVTDGPWPVPAPVVEPVPVALPDPTRLCGSLVLAAVEALAGTRPLVQLVRWVTPQVLEALTAAVSPPAPRPGRTGRPETSAAARGPARDRPAGGRATVRRTHLTRVSPTAAEARVVLHDGQRVRAAAVRLEVHRGHWRATVLQIG